MEFSFTEEQQEVRNLARKILEDGTQKERLREVEAGSEGIDRRLLDELARANLLGVGLPEAFGGSELGFVALCLLIEEVGRTVAPVPVLASLVLGALPVAEFGSPDQRRDLLPGVVAGELLLTAGLSESGADDPASPSTTASRVGGVWVLDGIKDCVPCGELAHRILVPARVDGGRVGAFLVDPAGPGVTLTRQQTTDRQPHSRLLLEGARLAPDALLGDLDRGADIVRWSTERAIAAYCMLQLGVSERALRMTADYTTTREQFGRPIGSFQAVHMRAGDAYIDVEAMRLTAWQAAWRLEAGLPASDAVAVAKYWAAEGGQRVGYAAQHLHGGIGIDVDYPLHRYYLWAKQIELTLGSAAVQLERIGDALAATRGADSSEPPNMSPAASRI